MQYTFIQFTEHDKRTVTLDPLHINALARHGVHRIDMDQRNIVKTAEPLMNQVNMSAIKSAHDDHDARAT